MTENKIEKITQSNSDTASTTGETISVSNTLLIFDFDDTLFCTKYLDSFSLPYKDIFDFQLSLEQANPCLFKEVKELEKNLSEDKKVNTQNSEDNIEYLNKNNESEKQLINENEIVIKEISENKKEIVQNDKKNIIDNIKNNKNENINKENKNENKEIKKVLKEENKELKTDYHFPIKIEFMNNYMKSYME